MSYELTEANIWNSMHTTRAATIKWLKEKSINSSFDAQIIISVSFQAEY